MVTPDLPKASAIGQMRRYQFDYHYSSCFAINFNASALAAAVKRAHWSGAPRYATGAARRHVLCTCTCNIAIRSNDRAVKIDECIADCNLV
jgi:hypothetical protein